MGVSHLPARDRVPDRYYVSPETAAVLAALEDQGEVYGSQVDDLLNQFFVDTATWSLPWWERKYSIPTDETLTVETRRAAVKKKMIASGNTTAEMVCSMAEALTGYSCRVVEKAEDYSFSLEFLGESAGFAAIDVDLLRDMVDDIKPAHLAFVIQNLTWKDVEAIGLTWQWFDDHPTTWEEFEGLFPIHGVDELV